ncbi:hypothetical protein SASPL_156951 [Salvia splendens]|uniref:Myb/SANT-like domain-containing protein n=1 Tax=Salvia splendens TaxID=180675 RepID=A0A8X8VVX5_SALSN|nr:hypothetical protein SASPL_156951 [Salvia splendens]
MADARRGNRGDRTRRSWSGKEEEILAATMKELVAQGWKSDNGFRSGYLNKIEEALKREFPTSDIKVNPHVQSKICSWKKNYSSLVTIMGRSGVGFNNNGDFKIDCEDDQWTQIMMIDSNARFMRNRSWPFWEDWKIIFGKDRATGSNAEDVIDVVNALYSQQNLDNTDTIPGEDFSLNGLSTEEGVSESLGTNASADSGSARERATDSGSARERAAPPPKRREMMGWIECTPFYIKCMKMPMHDCNCYQPGSGLSMDDKFDVCEMLAKEPDRLDIFMGLPENARYAYVMRVLLEKREKRGN